MRKKDDYDLMKETYINSSTLNAEALKTGDYKLANKNAKICNKVLKIIESNDSIKELFFGEIMNSDNIYARSYISTEAIRKNILKEKALKTLNDILELKDKEYALTQFGIKKFMEMVMPNL